VNGITLREQKLGEMIADESGCSGDEDAFHEAISWREGRCAVD